MQHRQTTTTDMRRFLEKYLLPIAMIMGILFHRYLSGFSPIIPWMLSLMLFITYSRVRWIDIRLTRFHYILLAIQYGGSALVYFALSPFDKVLAQATMICILTATATSAPVVTGLLGGSISTTATYSLISNLSVAFIGPLFLTLMGDHGSDIHFATTFLHILIRVMPVLIGPFLLALLVRKISTTLHRKIYSAQILSFYLWAITLTILIGNVTQFVKIHGDGNYVLELLIAGSTLLICLTQFFSGKRIGRLFDLKISGGQSLGQKNTVLAIWLTQTYLNPLATLGPGLYVLWQNIVNSWQIWKKKRSEQAS